MRKFTITLKENEEVVGLKKKDNTIYATFCSTEVERKFPKFRFGNALECNLHPPGVQVTGSFRMFTGKIEEESEDKRQLLFGFS